MHLIDSPSELSLDRRALSKLDELEQHHIRDLFFPEPLESAFFRYYDARYRHWFRIASGVIALFYALFLVGLLRNDPPGAVVRSPELVWGHATSLILTVLFIAAGGALTFTKLSLERLQLLIMPGCVMAVVSAYFITAQTFMVGQLTPTFQLIFQVMLAVVIGFRVRVRMALPLLFTMSAFMLGAAWVIAPSIQLSTVSQVFGSLLFASTLCYLFERDTRRDFAHITTIHKLATTDELTGALSRRHFLEQLEGMREEGFAMIMMDLDHFKDINDTYGHLAGDEALRVMVRVCEEVLRETDQLGRLGGEEFAIALRGATLEQAVQVAERVRKRVAAEQIRHRAHTFSMTVSCGVAVWEEGDSSSEDILGRSDRRLYIAKETGRDQVVSEDLFSSPVGD